MDDKTQTGIPEEEALKAFMMWMSIWVFILGGSIVARRHPSIRAFSPTRVGMHHPTDQSRTVFSFGMEPDEA